MGNYWSRVLHNLKFDLSKTEDKLKLFILMCGLLIVIGVGSVTAIQLTMSPEFCASCHEMTPQYVTWQVTSHSNIACTECHIEPGNLNLVKHKIGATKELYLHLTGSYKRPIVMKHPIPNNVCEQCHSPENRRFTPSGDLIIPHDRHSEKGIKCVDCHSGVAHGDIGRRGVTARGDLQAWTVSTGIKETAGKLSKPKMNACIECHMSKKVTTKCEACHTSIAIPDNHKEASFLLDHGTMAMNNIDYCNKCHSYSMEGSKIKTGNKVADYARGNAFCWNCHQKLPETHNHEWKIIHKKEARTDKAGCLVCHNENKPKDKERATKTYCYQCHGQLEQPGAGGSLYENKTFPRSHPPTWRQKHPSVVKDKGTMKSGCYDCHDRNNCSACHTSGGTTG